MLDVPATLGRLRILCACVAAACDAQSPAGRALARDVELAVQEAGSNVVRHAYDGQPGGRIRMELTISAGGIVADLFDAGRPFVEPEAAAAAPGEARVHGYGLLLMRRLMDEVEYRREGDRNHWRLRRSFAAGR